MSIIYSFFGLLICGGSIFTGIIFVLTLFHSPTRSQIDKNAPEFKDNFRFIKNKYLISRAERKYYVALYRVLKTTDHIAFPKVRLADVISIPKGTHSSLINSEFIKLKQEQIDFLICNRITLQPLLAIMISEKEHGNRRQHEEEYIIKALKSAQIPSIRAHFELHYDLKVLRNKLHDSIKM